MYKFRIKDIDEKIKYIKPNSFYKNAMEKIKKSKIFEEIQESAVSYEIETKQIQIDKNSTAAENNKMIVEETYGNPLSFMKTVSSKIAKAKKQERRKMELITESFNSNVFEDKTLKDLKYFNYLIESTLNPLENEIKNINELKEVLYDKIKEALVESVTLYKETNVKPRFLTPAFAKKELTENELINLYEVNFKKFLTENYLTPVRKNEFKDEIKSDLKKITKYLTENGIDANLDTLTLYLPFEKSIREFFESILIPEPSKYKINLFLENQDPIYFELFENNAKILQENVEEKIAHIASMIGPFLFKNKVDTDLESGYNPLKLAGLSIACERIDDGPMVCKAKKAEGIGAEEDLEDEIPDVSDKDASVADVADDIDDIDDIDIEKEKEAVEKAAEEEAVDLDKDEDSVEDAIVDELEAELEAEMEDKVAGPDDNIDIEKEMENVPEDSIDSEGSDEDKDEDKDHDGKKDSEEDHGELPEDFEGDHEDAEKESKKKDEKKTLSESDESGIDPTPLDNDSKISRSIKLAEEPGDLKNLKEVYKEHKNFNTEINKEEFVGDESANINKLEDVVKTHEDQNFKNFDK